LRAVEIGVSWVYRTLSEINAEVELLITLDNSGVSVSYPVPDQEGKYVFSIEAVEGVRYGVVFTHAGMRSLQNLIIFITMRI